MILERLIPQKVNGSLAGPISAHAWSQRRN